MTTQRASLGASGERAGARFLLSKGWQIIDQNVHILGGEIDLLARDGDCVVLVEVKTRTTVGETDPTANLNPAKLRQLARLAQAVADRYPEASVRVDALVIINQPYSISHYEDILN
jgi:putative endonuclease